MIRWRLAALLAVFLGLTAPLQADPFTGRATDEPVRVERASAPIAMIGRALLTFQREANRLIAQQMQAIRDGDSSLPLLIGMGLAFAYGVVHALGPGHGKLVVVSYFLSREARIGRGLLMGLQIAVCHVISAMAVVWLADILLRQAFGGPPAEVTGIRMVSYGLIALIGCFMLIQAIRRSQLRRAGQGGSAACCGHGEARAEEGFLSIGVGLVPCTGAVLILLYAMANDILAAGMVLVTAIAAGMAITMGVLGLLSVIARQTVAARVEATGHGSSRIVAVTDYAGALAIMAVGGGLFWATL